MRHDLRRREFLTSTGAVLATTMLSNAVIAAEGDASDGYVLPLAPPVSLKVAGATKRFPVRRIYCVGLNYPRTSEVMAQTPSLTKLGDSLVLMDKHRDAIVQDGSDIPYPQATSFLAPEVELVIAIGSSGVDVSEERALDHVFGYAVGNDLTRRDMSLEEQKVGAPVDPSKAFDFSAPCGTVYPVAKAGNVHNAHIWMTVDGKMKREGNTSAMVLKPAQLIATVSRLYRLVPGDLIYSGSPGMATKVEPGQTMVCGIDGLGTLTNKVVAAKRS